jgi:hypothetical protein
MLDSYVQYMIYGLYFLGLLSTCAAILTYLYLPKALRILLEEEEDEK